MGSPLVAFALVAEEYQRSGDPIKGLKPLFSPLLADRVGQAFNPSEFATRFKESYGLNMTPFVADALTERLVDIGLLSIAQGSTGSVHRYEVANFEWAPQVIDERQIDQTVELFSRWAQARLAPTKRTFSSDALEEAMLLRLARPEFASIFADGDSDKKNAKLKGLLGLGAIDPSAKDNVYLDYLVADFVLIAADSAPEIFKAISQIAYGSLVADAVAGLAVPGTFVLADPPLRVVFDGPLLLDLLDLNTVEHKIYAEGLLEMVKSAGLMTAVFDHSIDEMRESIRSTLHANQNGVAFGPLAERFRTTPGHTLYAVAVADSVEARVKALGFTVLRSEVYEEARFKKYFPDDRVDQIRNSIGDLHEHLDARIRDALSVATVARLKGEKKMAESIFLAGTIFITRNSVLARRVLRALAQGRSEPVPRFTIATDGQLAGVLWFVSGITGVELSRKRLIANCSSAVLPKPEVVSRIANVLSNMSEQLGEEFSGLMSDRRASLCPMRMTSGIAESIDQDKALQILQSMKEEIVAPVVARAQTAEILVAQREAELAQTSATAKEVVSVLQEAIGESENLRTTNEATFNAQLAQFEFDLNSARTKLELHQKNEDAHSKKLDDQILSAEAELSRKEVLAQNVIYALLSFIAIVATLISILAPSFDSVVVKGVLVLVALAASRWVSQAFGRFAVYIVSKMFGSRRAFIEGLKITRNMRD